VACDARMNNLRFMPHDACALGSRQHVSSTINQHFLDMTSKLKHGAQPERKAPRCGGEGRRPLFAPPHPHTRPTHRFPAAITATRHGCRPRRGCPPRRAGSSKHSARPW
jgi:hypothetical protein